MDHPEKEKHYGQNNSDGAFNPTFPSIQNVSEDSARPNFLESIPYQLNGDHSSEEALKKIRTANTIAISPGRLNLPQPNKFVTEKLTVLKNSSRNCI